MYQTLPRSGGPLDVVRQINREAADLDQFAQTVPGLAGSELYDDFVKVVFDKDKEQPLINQQVIVYGTPVTISSELDEATGELEIKTMAIAADQEYRRSSGKYAGLTVKTVYDPRTGEDSSRVVHMIYTGSGPAMPDEYGHMQQTHFYDYVLADGSEIIPYHPINAHSFEDLEGDSPITELEKIIFDGDLDAAQKLRQVGDLAVRIFRNLEHDDERNQQRLSYLNSLGLFDDVAMVAGDFFIGNRVAYEKAGELNFNDPNFKFVIYPDNFQLSSGYRRVPSRGEIMMGGSSELFIDARLEDGQEILAPFEPIRTIAATSRTLG